MKQIVCVSSVPSLGCTFLDWSIHFLSGKNKFFQAESKSWIDLVSNPLTDTNAHGHKKNHPAGFEQTQQFIKILQQADCQDLLSFYPCSLHADVAAQILNIDSSTGLDAQKLKKIQQLQLDDYGQLLDHCLSQNIKLIYVSISEKDIAYLKNSRHVDRHFFRAEKPVDSQEFKDEVDNLLFKHSKELWTTLNLTQVWDQRERLALDTRPFDYWKFKNIKFNRALPHLWIDVQSLWFNGEQTIKKIMSFCSLDIDASRWHPWLVVYRQWQNKQLEILEFQFNLPHIINAIVNNWYYPLGPLTFDQEIIIQHCLIYQHGLNLKTWQLEKFPLNTQDLHKLLEPNTHKIESIY